MKRKISEQEIKERNWNPKTIETSGDGEHEYTVKVIDGDGKTAQTPFQIRTNQKVLAHDLVKGMKEAISPDAQYRVLVMVDEEGVPHGHYNQPGYVQRHQDADLPFPARMKIEARVMKYITEREERDKSFTPRDKSVLIVTPTPTVRIPGRTTEPFHDFGKRNKPNSELIAHDGDTAIGTKGYIQKEYASKFVDFVGKKLGENPNTRGGRNLAKGVIAAALIGVMSLSGLAIKSSGDIERNQNSAQELEQIINSVPPQ